MADFMWSKWAVERGWSIDETAEKLLAVSSKTYPGFHGFLSWAYVTVGKGFVVLSQRGGGGAGTSLTNIWSEHFIRKLLELGNSDPSKRPLTTEHSASTSIMADEGMTVWVLPSWHADSFRPVQLFNLLRLIRHPLSESFSAYAEKYCAAGGRSMEWRRPELRARLN
jgi:hypothetical protein